MPPRKFRTRRRKIVRRRRRKRKTPLPDSYTTKLVYNDWINVSPGLASGYIIFRGNSIYDPESTGTIIGTNQRCYGIDAFDVLYKKYQVTSSKIEVEYHTTSASQAVVVLHTSTTSSTPTDVLDALGDNSAKSTISNIYAGSRKLTSTGSTMKLLGKTSGSSDDAVADVNNNPVAQWYHHLQISSANASNISGSLKVKITYNVKFSSRYGLIQS